MFLAGRFKFVAQHLLGGKDNTRERREIISPYLTPWITTSCDAFPPLHSTRVACSLAGSGSPSDMFLVELDVVLAFRKSWFFSQYLTTDNRSANLELLSLLTPAQAAIISNVPARCDTATPPGNPPQAWPPSLRHHTPLARPLFKSKRIQVLRTLYIVLCTSYVAVGRGQGQIAGCRTSVHLRA